MGQRCRERGCTYTLQARLQPYHCRDERQGTGGWPATSDRVTDIFRNLRIHISSYYSGAQPAIHHQAANVTSLLTAPLPPDTP